jgi:2-dehydropantoate 2-reductase
MARAKTDPKIVVMGAGAIGGTVAAHLADIGTDVTAVTRNTEVVDAVRRRGYELLEDGERRAVPGRIEKAIPQGERYDLVLLATQPLEVEEAARAALPHLRDSGHIVCFQNGLCEARVARLVAPHRVAGGIVAWGASMPEPGVYERTAQGGFTLGWFEPGPEAEPDADLRGIGCLLEGVGPVTYTSNLAGARWSKLALNCAISSLGTMAGERLGPLVRVRRYRRLGLEIFTEAVAVAEAEGVALEKVAGTLDLSWVALSAGDRARAASAGLTAKHALLLAVGLRYRRLRSSMLAAIERGRQPAIDFLNGEIVERGRARGIAAPVNAAVVETIRAIARGELRPSRDNLDRLYEATRARDAA